MPITIARQARGDAAWVIIGAAAQPAADPALVTLITRAHRTAAALLDGSLPPDRYAVRIARLAYLAPDITAAILEGRQPHAMTSRTLLMTSDLPLDWQAQRIRLGMTQPPAKNATQAA